MQTRYLLDVHPSTNNVEAIGVSATISQLDAEYLVVTYQLSASSGALVVPAPCETSRQDNLWQHTCCELFVGNPLTEAYREFNFSPSGQWAAYDFSGYRIRASTDPEVSPPKIQTVLSDKRLIVTVSVRLIDVCQSQPISDLKLSLASVIETISPPGSRPNLSYWATHHASPKPDFHHPDSFVLHGSILRQGTL